MQRIVTIVGFAAAVAVPSFAAEMSTATYRLPQTTFSAAGGRLQTSSYIVDTSAGQESTVGVAASSSYKVQSGFLNSQSTNPVPVELLQFVIVSGHESTDEPEGANVGDQS